uniref:E3 ubiquitin-protein ligase BRE1-like 1 isoform X2 n=1 Tax=Rhizophora mucronata TaxID=61149 RepID=A0A2P2JDX3_RHIMU
MFFEDCLQFQILELLIWGWKYRNKLMRER